MFFVEAMAGLSCRGSEWSLEECSWTVPDEACLSHAGDAIVYCSSAGASVPQGAVRLISTDGSPSIDGAGDEDHLTILGMDLISSTLQVCDRISCL